jgi:hypothetical protein
MSLQRRVGHLLKKRRTYCVYYLMRAACADAQVEDGGDLAAQRTGRGIDTL